MAMLITCLASHASYVEGEHVARGRNHGAQQPACSTITPVWLPKLPDICVMLMPPQQLPGPQHLAQLGGPAWHRPAGTQQQHSRDINQGLVNMQQPHQGAATLDRPQSYSS
jgi:hypothetical protein